MSVELLRPTSVTEAIAHLSEDDSLPLAGGTSVVLLMNTGLLDPGRLVSLGAIPGLDRIRLDGDAVEIGAMCTHRQLSRSPVLIAQLPEVASMFAHIGNIRVRAWATVGGNLAHADPAQDPPVLLGVLGASVLAQGPDGSRTIPVRELSDGPFSTVLASNELITAVRIPILDSAVRCAYLKFLPRTADDYATVSAAARIEFATDGTVIAADLMFGSVGPTPIFAPNAAAALVGRSTEDAEALNEMVEAVRETVSPQSDARGSAAFRREMAGTIARRVVLACSAR